MKNLLERFESKFVRRGPDECWLWMASTQKGTGYGKLGRGPAGSGWEYAHRIAWQLANGEIPTDLCVLHRCDNRICVNPNHLFLGTKAVNADDRNRKGRTKPGRPSRGETNGRAKLSREDVVKIRLMRTTGAASFAEIGAAFGVSGEHARRVCAGQNWTDIDVLAEDGKHG